VVGAAVADEVDAAVLGDDAVAQGAGQARATVAADPDRGLTARRHGVVDHHAVDRTPGALVVAVVLLPVTDLDDRDALVSEDAENCPRTWVGP
jgi:hypothetical protein